MPGVLRGDGAVGVLADDRVALLGAQHVHGLGAVRGDVELRAGRVHVLPDRAARTRPDTLISKASSPEKEIRQTRAGTPEARVVSRKAMNGKASL